MITLKKTSKFMQAGLLCLVFFFVLVALYFAWGRSLFKAEKKLKTEFSLKQSELKEQEVLIRTVPDPKKAIEEIEKKADEFKDIEVGKRQVPRLIHLLGSAAAEHNINIVSIRPREDIKVANENLPSGVTKVYVEMVLGCPYQVLGGYLADLGKLPVTFIIESVSIAPREETATPAPDAKKAAVSKGERPQELLITLLLSTYMIYEI